MGGHGSHTGQPIRVDEINNIWAYLATVNWTERWFLGLGGFHIVCLLLTFGTRRYQTAHTAVFFLYLFLVFVSEYINEFAAKNWRYFAEQQYFDSSGLFITIVFSVPILLNACIVVVMWMKTAWDMMVTVKSRQIRQRISEQAVTTEEEKKEQ